ncbi:flagellar hook-basal body complex protein FliE [Rhizobium halophytocola]|uniref:Flagellar hook-basal body complex protein FliE n=1 Tax=Rhizobium halophytocola TaxID=735519 RepID=A0ABS4E5B2_9HYPH|nr:flagellar hook-basal body complex protein FliE [Rhizobium halophytocola]MBP1853117.1 flagellar hook-basal body complex protein FliE [Rhizobium halophytocola]
MIDSVTNVSSLSLTKGLGSLVETDKSSQTQAVPGLTMDGTTPGTQTGQSFADVMGSMATDALGSLKQAESMSFDGITGKANTREVVDAVLNAEQTLQTALAFRDKIVSAYLEITKMQI